VKQSISFGAACLYELLLLVLAVIWSLLLDRSLLRQTEFNLRDMILSAVATVPMLALFLWTLHSRHPSMVSHRRLVNGLIRPLFQDWSLAQLAIISLLAGLCEEAFFRTVLQDGVSAWLGEGWGLAVAALLFGAAHLLTWSYAILATLIGGYLGLLYSLTGNLLVPAATHACYDFLALIWLLRRPRENAAPDPP
jgi:uncharacterized protein